MRFHSLLLAGLILLTLSACGKKGPVRPLEEKLPQSVQRASLLQRGDSFQLQWQMPQRNQDGSPLDLESVDIERLFIADADFCPECPDPWPKIARIYPQLPAPAQRVRNLYLLSDRGATTGQSAHYSLKARNTQGDFGPPLVLTQPYRQPVEAPTDLQARGHDRSIELRWQASPPPEDAILVGYQIYRRAAGQSFSPLPTTMRPLNKTAFSDFGLENNRIYYYRVRSLFDFDGQKLESLPSREVSATPAAG